MPTSFEETPERWLPELPIWSFCENASRSQGIEDFGLRVGLGTDVAEIGAFGRALRAATTLRDALETFLRDLNTHSSCGRYGLKRDCEWVWFWRTGVAGLRCDPVEQYVVGLMVQIVRLAAGPHWAADHVALQASGLPGGLAAETFAGARIQLRAPLSAVRFPSVLLATPLRSPGRDEESALAGLQFEQPPENLVDSLKLGLESALPHGSPGLRWAAHAANMSPRTL
ncbi:MAG: AraC family transcriptional regulator ligand-binding domain-containing protein [Deltaproteobacteria bacterium]|nr:AraC family transcriptional regulator ligand-binding domain-containing protein [Deltaproteobacteria bacterium]MBW2394954.1 AraC family transcriptional regulator ligand-binding domain-containing protein [Deltaproteobacteria bacterium]